MSKTLEARFDHAIMQLYQRARDECGYNATRFLQMLHEHRGLETARILLHASKVSEGYVALWERKRLDLTVESLILAEEWRPLFSEEAREIARNRLAEYGHTPKVDPIRNVIHDGIKQPIRLLLEHGHYRAALILTFAGIDSMAFLGMPATQAGVTKNDFVAWAERYIQIPADPPISGLEWYGARCGLVHTYTPYSTLSREKDCRIIGYVDDMLPPVKFDPAISPILVMISTRAIIEAFFAGTDAFLTDLYADQKRAQLANQRFTAMFHHLTYDD